MGALQIGADFQSNLIILIVQILQVQRHDQRCLRLWLRTKPTGFLDKVKVYRGWKCDDGKKTWGHYPCHLNKTQHHVPSLTHYPPPPPRWTPMIPWTLGAPRTVDVASGCASETWCRRWWYCYGQELLTTFILDGFLVTIFDQHVLALAARQTENHQLKALALLFSWRTGKSLDYFLGGAVKSEWK